MIRQAIPTDFMGVRFRSKSEAMFANLLENSGQMWFYEPSFLAVGDYTPDFISIAKVNNRQLFANVVEYKPGRPTKAYFERLLKKSNDIFKHLGSVKKSFSIVSINFFEPFAPKCWSVVSGAWVEVNEVGFSEAAISRARNYRYDLDHSVELLPEQKTHDQTVNIRLIAAREESHRIKRLEEVIRILRDDCPKVLGFLSALEDDKGHLTCSWGPNSPRVGNGKTTVEMAWESVGELACNVTHKYI